MWFLGVKSVFYGAVFVFSKFSIFFLILLNEVKTHPNHTSSCVQQTSPKYSLPLAKDLTFLGNVSCMIEKNVMERLKTEVVYGKNCYISVFFLRKKRHFYSKYVRFYITFFIN